MFINRDWNRKENDDFQLRVKPKMDRFDMATPTYHNGVVVGWTVKGAYE